MRILAAGLVLMAGVALAEEPPAVPPVPEPEISSGSSTPEIVKRVLEDKPAPLPPHPSASEDEARRRLVMILVMRNAARGFPSLLLRPAE
jgi:hypothetical protein